MNRVPRMNLAHAFRRLAVPLASYYAVTLALPLANGAARSGTPFVEHALVVLLVPPVVIVLACGVHMIARAFAGGGRSRLLRRGSGRGNYQDGVKSLVLA